MHEFEIRMYVLRLWHEPTAGPETGIWRASLLNPLNRKRRYFSDLAKLAAYLTVFDPVWPEEEDTCETDAGSEEKSEGEE